MNKQLFMGIAIATALMATSGAAATLVFDADPYTSGVQPGDPSLPPIPWQSGFGDYWTADGGMTNVAWNNASQDVAQFGTASTDLLSNVSIFGTVVVSGLHQLGRQGSLSGGTIQFAGTNPTFTMTNNVSYCTTYVTNASQTLTFVAADTAAAHLYFEAANFDTGTPATIGDFDGPVIFGDGINSISANVRSPYSLSSSAGSFTVNEKSAMIFDCREAMGDYYFTVNNPLTISGIGRDGATLAQSGAIVIAGGNSVNFEGPITLSGDARINFYTPVTIAEEMVFSAINGPVNGDYTLEFYSRNYAAGTTMFDLNNSVNVKSLSLFGAATSTKSKNYVRVNSTVTATDNITVGAGLRLYVTNDGSSNGVINTPRLILTTGRSYVGQTMYAPPYGTGTPLTFGAGQTVEGIGELITSVKFENGATMSPGLEGENGNNGKLTAYFTDLSNGGNYLWNLSALKDSSEMTADELYYGTYADTIRATGLMTLGGTSTLTLDFSLLDAAGTGPSSSDPFWNSNHSWRIMYDADTAGETVDPFPVDTWGSIVSPGLAPEILALFSTSIVGRAADGKMYQDMYLNYIAPPPPEIPGDANGDGHVDTADANALATNWGATEATWAMGDFNHDGRVNAADASILAANWTGSAESAAVPEPSALALLAVGLGVIGLLRRQR